MSDLNGFEIPSPLLMTLPQVAAALGIHRSTMHKICLAGGGPKWIWVGSKIMVRRKDFQTWLDSATRTGAGKRLIGADL